MTFYNKRTLSATEKFIKQASEVRPTIIQNIKLRYWTTSGQRSQVYPNNHCDLYLFDSCIAIVRRQDFIFKAFFAPILLTSDIATTKNMFDYLDIYKPDRINFRQTVKGEIDIKLTDLIYEHFIIDITLKIITYE